MRIFKFRDKLNHNFYNQVISYKTVLYLKIIITIIGLTQMWITANYFSKPFSERIGWFPVDGSWEPAYKLGNHFFGDYLAMHLASKFDNPWEISNFYPPFAMVLFKIFTIFPYKFGLILWLFLIAFCAISPLIHSTKNLRFETRLILIFFFGLCSASFLGMLDRGNCIGFIVPLIYFAIIKAFEDKNNLAAILFGLAIAIKIYPLLLLPFFLFEKKYLLIIKSISVSLIITFFSSLIWGNPVRIISDVMNAARNFEGLNVFGGQMIFSFSATLNNFRSALLGDQANFNFLINQHPIFIGFLLYLFLFLTLHTLSNVDRFIVAVAVLQLIPTISYTYTRLWCVISFSLIIYFKKLNFDISQTSYQIFGIVCSIILIDSIWVVFLPKNVNLLPTLGISILILTLTSRISKPILSNT